MIVKATSLVAGTWRVHVCPPVKGNESDIRSICRNAVKTPFYTLLTWERCPRRYTFIRRLEPSSALGASRLQAELKWCFLPKLNLAPRWYNNNTFFRTSQVTRIMGLPRGFKTQPECFTIMWEFMSVHLIPNYWDNETQKRVIVILSA
jgi:hypothetical protein